MAIFTGLKQTSAIFTVILGMGSFANLGATTIPSAVLPTGNLACNTTTATFGAQPCSTFGINGVDAALTAGLDGITGLKFYLSGGLADNESNGAKTTTVALTSSGTVTGQPAPAGIFVPFTYDFTLATKQ